MTWSPAQYGKFEDERNRPIHDLLAHISATEVGTAVDIGCGPGNSTELLLQRFPDATIVGLDSSPEMIAAARQRLPQLRFSVEDIATWHDPGPFDVILANAALQWIPDHEQLLPALIAKLAPGGSLAVQMPDNLDEPAHRLMREVAATGPWADRLNTATQARAPRRSADWYYRLLCTRVSGLDMWRTVYHHPLSGGADAVVEWFKGSGLRPFLAPLSPTERDAYLTLYRQAVADAYPVARDGRVLLPFPRLFFVATR
jgi:trans-aconitate 2-methyltransferase